MSINSGSESIKGDRSMTQGFVAQYAAESAMQIDGVVSLVPSFAVALKEKAGVVHEGKGVRVIFDEHNSNSVAVTIYPVISFGKIIPEVAWNIQEKVKVDVEKFTGLKVDSVDVYVCGVVEDTDNSKEVSTAKDDKNDDISKFYTGPVKKADDSSKSDSSDDDNQGVWFKFK